MIRLRGKLMRSRFLSEIALFSSIIIVLSLFSNFVPVIGTFTALLTPLPFALLTIRNGWKGFLSSLLITFLGALIVLGLIKAIFLIIGPGIVGGVTGLGISLFEREKEKSFSLLVGMSILGVLLSFLIVLHLSKLVLHQDILEMSIKSTVKSFELSKEVISKMGLEDPYQGVNLSPDVIVILLPIMIISATFAYAIFNLWLTLKVLSKIDEKAPQFLPLSKWGLEKWAIITFILTILTLFLPALNSNLYELSYIAAPNLMLFSLALGLIHTTAYWGNRYGFVGGLLAFLIAYQIPILSLMFCLMDLILGLSSGKRDGNSHGELSRGNSGNA